jgi:hypothetical protein
VPRNGASQGDASDDVVYGGALGDLQLLVAIVLSDAQALADHF